MKSTVSEIELKAAARNLPPSPQIFGKLGRLLKNPETGVNEITDLVNTDGSLAGQLLRISNSAAYNNGDPIESVEEAINRIGFHELFKMVGVAAASKTFTIRNVTYGVDGSLLWSNSLATALAMEALARFSGEDPQEGYTLGLLKSMGKIVLNLCVRGQYGSPKYDFRAEPPLLEWEEGNVGLSNAKATSIVLNSWNFPEEACQAIEFMYEPDLVPGSNPYCRLLNISSGIAEQVGQKLYGETNYWKLDQEYLDELELSDSQVNKATVHVKHQLEQLTTAMKSL